MFEEEIGYHQDLFDGSALEMGKILWYLQKADTEMENKCWIKKEKLLEGTELKISNDELTDFGKEVNLDEIHWWIFKKETCIEELRKRTECTLNNVQKLKEDSSALKERYIAESYYDLIKKLKEFTESHKKEIDTLYEYVVWLYEKDVLAPSILFNYRVWGSTRLADRKIDIISNNIDEDSEILKISTEFALGLKDPTRYNLIGIYTNISYDIWESTDPEYRSSITVPRQNLIIQTSHKILDEFATFIELIRQALRNIIIDINKYDDINNLLCSPSNKRSDLGEPFAFISHDSRDKHVAKHIAIALTDIECPVWYDEYSLKVGDNLRESIEKGLKECKKCILILSPNYLSNKGWTKVEFDSIFTREIIEEKNIILPVWLGVDKKEIYGYSPSLANKYAAKWSLGKDIVINKLHEAINSD